MCFRMLLDDEVHQAVDPGMELNVPFGGDADEPPRNTPAKSTCVSSVGVPLSRFLPATST